MSGTSSLPTRRWSSDDRSYHPAETQGAPARARCRVPPLQFDALSEVAAELDATPMQVALAWLLQRSPNLLLIPGTSSVAHLTENLKSADLVLSEEAVAQLNRIGAD